MTRTERIQRRAAEILAEAIDKEMAPMLVAVAFVRAEDELGPPPYELNRVRLHVVAQVDGVPVEDL